MLINMTSQIDIDSFDRQMAKSAKYNCGYRFHAIYKMANGTDFCRDNAPKRINSYEFAIDWAQNRFDKVATQRARNAVAGFAIDYW